MRRQNLKQTTFNNPEINDNRIFINVINKIVLPKNFCALKIKKNLSDKIRKKKKQKKYEHEKQMKNDEISSVLLNSLNNIKQNSYNNTNNSSFQKLNFFFSQFKINIDNYNEELFYNLNENIKKKKCNLLTSLSKSKSLFRRKIELIYSLMKEIIELCENINYEDLNNLEKESLLLNSTVFSSESEDAFTKNNYSNNESDAISDEGSIKSINKTNYKILNPSLISTRKFKTSLQAISK